LVCQNEIVYGDYDVLVNVVYKSIDERRANIVDALLNPFFVMEEITLASEDSQIYSKVIILAINNLDQALLVLDLLCNIKYP